MTYGAEDGEWYEPPDDSMMQDAIHMALTDPERFFDLRSHEPPRTEPEPPKPK